MARKYMKTILTAVIAIVAIVAGVLIMLFGDGDGKLTGVIIVVISTTVSSLVSLQESQQTTHKVNQVEKSTERIDKVVNHEAEVPHRDSTIAKYRKESR